jgi:hypothetical protein
MDKLTNYRRIIERIVAQHAEYTPSHGQIESIPVCDIAHDNYLLMDLGWDRNGRIHEIVFHLRIHNSKIWIEWDGTEDGIAQSLLDSGVPKEDIVLAFYRPEQRLLTEFAIT